MGNILVVIGEMACHIGEWKWRRRGFREGGLKWAESNYNAESESVRVESSKEDSRWNEERGALTRSDGLRERNVSSSCSSYYPFSSADFDGEINVRDKHGQLIEESLTGCEDSGVNGGR